MNYRVLGVGLGFLFLSLVPYILWQQDIIFLRPFISILPSEVEWYGTFLERMVRCYFSDMMWFLSFLIIQDSLTNYKTNILTYCGYVLPFVCEIGQIAGFMPGTFDFGDITIYFVTLISYILWRKRILSKRARHSVF